MSKIIRLVTGCLMITALLWIQSAPAVRPSAASSLSLAAGQALAAPFPSGAALIGTLFTYQGRLNDNGAPAEGSYDFRFLLFNALDGGIQVGPTLTQDNLSVTQGVFVTTLDFGDLYDGTVLFLEVQVRPGDSTAGYTTLTPRQALNPTPYALYAARAGNAESAASAEALGGQPADYFQARVSAACAPGSAIRAISAGGEVTCQPAPPLWTRNIIDLVEDNTIGTSLAMALGSDGLPLIAYYNPILEGLYVTHCEDIYCSQITTSLLDSGTNVGRNPEIVIGSDGLGLIVYSHPQQGLRLGHCSDLVCSTFSSILSLGEGSSSAVAIDHEGMPVLAHKTLDGNLNVLRCDDVLCSTFTHHTIAAPQVINYVSLVIGSDGFPLIAFSDIFASLYVVHCQIVSCVYNFGPHLISNNVLDAPLEMALGSDGFARLLYTVVTDTKNYLLVCSNAACTSGPRYTLGMSMNMSSLDFLLPPDGNPLLLFNQSGTGYTFAARCLDEFCSSVNTNYLSTFPGSGVRAILGADGLPMIVLRLETGADTKRQVTAIHCDDLNCLP